jgi:CBS-domain-containing membrane protein
MDRDAVVGARRDQLGLPRILLVEDERELAEMLVRLLLDHGVSALPIVDDRHHVVGVVSEDLDPRTAS